MKGDSNPAHDLDTVDGGPASTRSLRSYGDSDVVKIPMTEVVGREPWSLVGPLAKINTLVFRARLHLLTVKVLALPVGSPT